LYYRAVSLEILNGNWNKKKHLHSHCYFTVVVILLFILAKILWSTDHNILEDDAVFTFDIEMVT
jgi:hypothetical protein